MGKPTPKPTPPPTSALCTPRDKTNCDDGINLGTPKEESSAGDCCKSCEATKGCTAWTWNKNTAVMKKYCFLKADCKNPSPHPDIVSGSSGNVTFAFTDQTVV